MAGPSYSPARVVAQRLQAFFAANAGEEGGVPATPPEAAAVEAVIGAAFWASLRREEGRAPRISVALLPPERTERRCFSTPACPSTPRPSRRSRRRSSVRGSTWGCGDSTAN